MVLEAELRSRSIAPSATSAAAGLGAPLSDDLRPDAEPAPDAERKARLAFWAGVSPEAASSNDMRHNGEPPFCGVVGSLRG